MRKILSTQHVNFLFVFSLSPGRAFIMNGNEELDFCHVSKLHINTSHIQSYILNFVRAARLHSNLVASETVHK